MVACRVFPERFHIPLKGMRYPRVGCTALKYSRFLPKHPVCIPIANFSRPT